MLRWQLTVYIMIFLRVYSHLQVMILLFISFTIQLMIVHGRPKESTADNISALFNEVMVSVYLYNMMSLMISQDSMTDYLGWALVGVIFIAVIVNFLKFAIQLIITGIQLIMRKWKFQVLKRRAQ